MTGSLGCAGLAGANFTYTIRQKQLLQSTLHLLFVYLKLKVCSDKHMFPEHWKVHCRLEAPPSVLMTCGTGCCQVESMASYAGRVQDQRLEVRCHSNQGQHASVQQNSPNISRLDPDLQQQWDHAANAHLGPISVTPKNGRKVGWICDQCPDGHLHRWEAMVANRSNGNGCPQCSGRKVCKHNSLATKAPSVAAQWDYEANDGTPDSLVAHSNQLVGWLCEVCGHNWSATPHSRISKKAGCPKCGDHAKGKQATQPTFAECQDPRSKALLAEWDHARNAPQGNFPHNTRLKSHKQIFWLCTKCPAGQEHSWPSGPRHRTGRSKTGCPFCTGQAACKCNSLQELYPDVAAEWDHARNQNQPSDYTGSSSFVAWWFTPRRGNWQQTINARTQQRLRQL